MKWPILFAVLVVWNGVAAWNGTAARGELFSAFCCGVSAVCLAWSAGSWLIGQREKEAVG